MGGDSVRGCVMVADREVKQDTPASGAQLAAKPRIIHSFRGQGFAAA